MTYAFSFGFVVTEGEGDQNITGARLEVLADQLMQAMLERETALVFDSSVGATLAAGEVDVEVEVEAVHEQAATATARDFVIESIRAIGGTPIGLFVFPVEPKTGSPRQEWHERKAELASA